jgi:hypothetical protein
MRRRMDFREMQKLTYWFGKQILTHHKKFVYVFKDFGGADFR